MYETSSNECLFVVDLTTPLIAKRLSQVGSSPASYLGGLGWNIIPVTGYYDWSLPWFSSVHLDKCWDCSLNYATTAFSHIITHVLLINNPISRRCIAWATDPVWQLHWMHVTQWKSLSLQFTLRITLARGINELYTIWNRKFTCIIKQPCSMFTCIFACLLALTKPKNDQWWR
jgi:hypothetical protein